MKGFFDLFCFDVRLQIRRPALWAALVLFFLIVILLLPFAIGPDADLLRRLAPGLIWLAVLLMSLLSLDKLFIEDARDGTLDLMRQSSLSLPVVVLSKLSAQIVTMLLALLVMIPLSALLLGMRMEVLPILTGSLLLGVPALILIGGIMASITIGLDRHPALLTLLLIPFYIPILIFALSACDAVLLGASARPHLFLLAALLALLLPLSPFVISAALRNAEG